MAKSIWHDLPEEANEEIELLYGEKMQLETQTMHRVEKRFWILSSLELRKVELDGKVQFSYRTV